MSKITLVQGSCADQNTDVIVMQQVAESTKQCCRAYRKFIGEYPDYEIEVRLCVFSANQMQEAASEFGKYEF